MNARLLLAVAAVSLIGTAQAKSPGGGSGGGRTTSGIPQERRLEQDISGSDAIPGRIEAAGVQIEGKVLSGSGDPIGDVLVKLFSNGVVTNSARTKGDGTFRIEGNPPMGGTNTTVLWFQSPEPDRLLDVQAVLSEGTVAREHKLFPECVQEVTVLGGGARVEVRLMTSDELQAAVEASGCLEKDS